MHCLVYLLRRRVLKKVRSLLICLFIYSVVANWSDSGLSFDWASQILVSKGPADGIKKTGKVLKKLADRQHKRMGSLRQGDSIGLIFAFWAIVFFGQFFTGVA
jgi:hypothetical protein